jgi:hypothetical protein
VSSDVRALAYLDKIDVSDVEAYARAVGWTKYKDRKGEVSILRKPGYEGEILLPLKSEFRDYFDVMYQSISALAAVQSLKPFELISELLLGPTDILRFGVKSGSTQYGSIVLQQGIDLFEGARKALLASACSVIKPQLLHPKLNRAPAENFVNRCRIGQTQPGSFLVSFICPVGKDTSQDVGLELHISKDQVTFGRRVTSSLLGAVVNLVEAVEKDEFGTLDDFAMSHNITANLCEALALMQPDDDQSAIVIKPEWSLGLPMPTINVGPVVIRKKQFPVIEQVGLELRRWKWKPVPKYFVGLVDELRGFPNQLDEMEGDIIVTFQYEDELLKARIYLNPTDYTVACDAHRDQRFIYVEGELHWHVRLHEIKNYRRFQVIESADERYSEFEE